MNYLAYILFLVLLPMNTLGQFQVQFRTGDHIYLLETKHDIPQHHQVGHACNPDGSVEFFKELIRDGTPVCEIYFDPAAAGTLTLMKGTNGKMYVQSMADRLNKNLLAVNHDSITQPIFYNGKVELSQDRYLVIQTPHLTRATSFKICTNNRVFVFVKNPSVTAKKL